MEHAKLVLTVKIPKMQIEEDLEIPAFITANDLVIALNTIYDLGIDVGNIADCYLRAENPIALLKGNRTLEEFGLYHGSQIIIDK